MNLKQLVKKSDYAIAYEEWCKYYCKEKQYADYDTFEGILLKLATMDIIENETGLKYLIVSEFLEDGELHYHASSRHDYDNEDWSVDGIPWNILSGLEVIQRNCGTKTINEKILVHIIWAMSWNGFDEETIQNNTRKMFEDFEDLDDEDN